MYPGRLEARRPSQAGCLTSGFRLRVETETFRRRRRIAEFFDLAREEIYLGHRANHAVVAALDRLAQTSRRARKVL